MQIQYKSDIIYYVCLYVYVKITLKGLKTAMSNMYSGITPTITVESVNAFSASFVASRIAPVCSVVVSDIPKEPFGFSLEIVCSDKEQEFFTLSEKTYDALDLSLFSKEPLSSLTVKLDYNDFIINTKSLLTIFKDTAAVVSVKIKINDNEFVKNTDIIISPCTLWQGISTHPETLAAFVMPKDKEVLSITEGLQQYTFYPSDKQVLDVTEKIIRRIRERNVVCTKRDSYSPEKKQEIKRADVLSNKGTFLASPVELAVIFSACAEKCGLNPIIVFVKNTLGVTGIYCGIRTADISSSNVIFESMSRVRRAIKNSELILFDPAILSSAQNVEVLYANQSAFSNISKNSTELILALDISSARKSGIMPYADGVVQLQFKTSPREVLGDIYTSLINHPVFKLLNGNYESYDYVPITGNAFERFSREDSESFVLRPLDISEKISDFAGFADGVASFALKDEKSKDYNNNDIVSVMERFVSFKERINQKNYFTAGIYESSFHERVSRMTFGNIPGMKNYLIAGFVRLADAEKGEARYFPACFVEICLNNKYDYKLSRANSRIIVNNVLSSYLSSQDCPVSKTSSIDDVLSYFEEVVENINSQNKNNSAITVLRECAIVKADLADFILWNDIKNNGKTMLANANFAAVLTADKKMLEQTDKIPDSYVFPLYAPEKINSAVKSNSNIILAGNSTREKSDIVVNKCAHSLLDGKTVLVSSPNKAFLDEIYKCLEENGLSEAALKLYDSNDTKKLYETVCEKIAHSKESPDYTLTDSSGELYNSIRALRSFSDLIHKQDDNLGISIIDALLSYNGARVGSDGQPIDTLRVSENLFNNITVREFNKLFEKADALLVSAKKTLNAAALPLETPLKEHPLYPVIQDKKLNESTLKEAFEIIERVILIFSEYRECFLDIADDIGIDITDIKTLSAVYSLNELYKLIISARELEFSDDFMLDDIYSFANDATQVQAARKRAENIEYKLKFFGKEIFEDVELLLSGYDPDEKIDGGLFKKFIVRRNYKDVLLQYISPENKAELSKYSVEDIFSNLDEYKQIKDFISGKNKDLTEESTVALASFAKSIADEVSNIYPDIVSDKSKLNKKCSKIFDFTKIVADDPEMSKKITYARAKFAQAYSENECLISRLCSIAGADFNILNFENGILNYDGFTAFLKAFEQNIPSYSYWSEWLYAKTQLEALMPSFASYIENIGIKTDTDRVFACSLINPAIEFLTTKHKIAERKLSFDLAKKAFPDQLEKERELSRFNALASYRAKVKKYSIDVDENEISYSENIPYSDFVNKHGKMLFNLFPIILIDSNDAGVYFAGNRVADTLACDNLELKMLSSLSCAKNIMNVSFAKTESIESEYLSKAFTKTCDDICDVSYHLYPYSHKLGLLSGTGTYMYPANYNEEISVISVNVTMRRTGDMANQSEAEVAVSKVTDLVSKGEKNIGIFTFSHGQYAYISHLLCLNAENDKNLGLALDEESVKVVDATIPCYDSFDTAIVSLGAAEDKSGNIGWSFGYSSETEPLVNISNAAVDKIMLISSLSSKELEKLKSSSKDAAKLEQVISMLPHGALPLKAKNCSRMTAPENDYVWSFGYGNIGTDFVNSNVSSSYSIDPDSFEDFTDVLSLCSVLNRNGISSKSVSLLDERFPNKSLNN